MQTITIQANESFIQEIKELIQQKAKALNEKVSFKNESKAVKVDTIKEQLLQDIKDYKAGKLETLTLDELKRELNHRADEALQGKGLIDEKEALRKFESIRTGNYAN